jgi:hypothetical protein
MVRQDQHSILLIEPSMHPSDTTQISPSGLRYTVKQNGSPYRDLGGSGETLSCIKCGHHKLRRNGVFKRYVTALMFLCFDCKPKSINP